MKAEWYLNILQDEIRLVISSWENIEDLTFMQDDAPLLFTIVVREWLNAHFLGRWMSLCGSHEWPARTPDLILCDYFLWGLLKEQVSSTKPTTLEEL